jgi:hypothetical protein
MECIVNDIDEPPIFCREKWIGNNKIHPHKELLLFVINTCAIATQPSQFDDEVSYLPTCSKGFRLQRAPAS